MVTRKAWKKGVLVRAWKVFHSHGATATVQRAVAGIESLFSFGYKRICGRQTFVYNGVELECLVHLYNRTWTNEREVELPLARAFLAAHPGSLLEVGNVTVHYGHRGHVVIDKYEEHSDVLNVDILDYCPAERFQAIVCISTLEHVGWDEEPKDPAKIEKAVRHLRGLLSPGGRMLITCPLSYNPHLDKLVAEDRFKPTEESFLVRGASGWQQTGRVQALAQARHDGRGGNAIWIAEFSVRDIDIA